MLQEHVRASARWDIKENENRQETMEGGMKGTKGGKAKKLNL